MSSQMAKSVSILKAASGTTDVTAVGFGDIAFMLVDVRCNGRIQAGLRG